MGGVGGGEGCGRGREGRGRREGRSGMTERYRELVVGYLLFKQAEKTGFQLAIKKVTSHDQISR